VGFAGGTCALRIARGVALGARLTSCNPLLLPARPRSGRSAPCLYHLPVLTHAIEALGLAVGLGLLVGLQRERADSRLAGLRTFPLITVFGVLCALLSQTFGGWVFAGSFAALAAVVVIGNLMAARREQYHPGITTEIAILVMFAVGAVLVTGPREVAVIVGAGVAVLLQAKPVLRGVLDRFSDEDVRGIMRLALVALVILPILPNRTMGPYDVLNPREIWFMVVLVVGVSFVGYLAQRLIGSHRGTIVAGLLGGLVSSTATTVGFARQTRAGAGLERMAMLVILLAVTVLHARVLIEIGVVGPGVFRVMAPPIAVSGAAVVILALFAWLRVRTESPSDAVTSNPAELKVAIWFAVLYAGVLLALAAGREHFGDQSVYVIALLSGATDMDAITLSSTRLATDGTLPADVAWRAVLIASIANAAFKTAMIWALGTRALGRMATAWLGIHVLVALAIVLVWP